MPRLNKPLVGHLEKIPAKTHSGLYYRYTFQLNDADSKNLSKAAKAVGISEAEYCKRQVLKSFGEFRLAKLKIETPVEPPVKPPTIKYKAVGGASKIAVPVASVLLLRERAYTQKLTPAMAIFFERLVEYFDSKDAWIHKSCLTIGNEMGEAAQLISGRIKRYIELGLLDVAYGGGKINPNKYRLPILSKYTPQELEQHKALNSKNGGAQ